MIIRRRLEILDDRTVAGPIDGVEDRLSVSREDERRQILQHEGDHQSDEASKKQSDGHL